MADNVFNGYDAGHVNVERSAVRDLNAQTANVERSAVQQLSADVVSAHSSAMGTINASTFEAHESAVAAVVSDYARVENSNVAVLIAPRVNGNVKAVITLPAAFAFGFGYFFARRLAGAIFGRSGR